MIALNTKHPIDAREIRARLDTPNVRILLSRGYTLTEIQQVIEERLRNTGDDFPSIIDLAQAINNNRERLGSSTASAAQLPLNSTNQYSYTGNLANHNSVNNSNSTDGFAIDGPSASWQKPRVTGASNQSSPPSSRHREYAMRRTLDDEVDAIDASTDIATDSFIPPTIRYIPRDIERLKAEQRQLIEANRCKLCLDQTIGSVILPCGHACTCVSCVTMVTHCPMCRMFIRGTVKINMD